MSFKHFFLAASVVAVAMLLATPASAGVQAKIQTQVTMQPAPVQQLVVPRTVYVPQTVATFQVPQVAYYQAQIATVEVKPPRVGFFQQLRIKRQTKKALRAAKVEAVPVTTLGCEN